MDTEEPNAKRQKKSSGASTSDRITLDVGGTKFSTTAPTLTSDSTYFASLLSENWINSKDGDELFLDQDPAAFGALLAYMRVGMILVEDITVNVLALAEFLGVERLLLAVKVRWYCNIRKRPALSTDEEIAALFDREHGGVMKAVSAGLLPVFLAKNAMNMDFATVSPGGLGQFGKICDVREGGGPVVRCDSFIGAINGLFAKGYTTHEAQIEPHSRSEGSKMTFSRREHSGGSSSGILVSLKGDVETQGSLNFTRQFALLSLKDGQYTIMEQSSVSGDIAAPAEFSEDEQIRANPYGRALIRHPHGTWLAENNFLTREEWLEGSLESIVKNHYNHPNDYESERLEFRIYSRVVPLSHVEGDRD